MATVSRERPALGTARVGLSREQAERRERRFRLAAAWAVWWFLFQGAVGLAWDIRWHTAFGRHTFWIPPHLLIYSGVALAGLTCLAVVLIDTWQFHRGSPAVTGATTWSLLGVVRAPLGFLVAGSGLAVMLAAAPFDDWWHVLYGLDVTLWAPFHVMGLVGALIAGVGLTYAFAALAVRARREVAGGATGRLSGLDWAVLLTLSGLASHLLTNAQPATTIAPTTELGPLRFLTFPVLLCAFLPAILVAAVRFTGRPGAASLTLGLYLLRQVLVTAFVPWAIRLLAARNGYEYRAAAPHFSLLTALLPLFFLPAAVAIDLVAARRRRATGASAAAAEAADALDGRAAVLAGLLAALPLAAAAPWLVVRTATATRAGQIPLEFTVPFVNLAPALLAALPLALAAAVLSATIGAGWGAVLRENDR